MAKHLKISLLGFSFILLNCSVRNYETKDIVGSWYFVEYVFDKPLQKNELPVIDNNTIESAIRNFRYIFKEDKTFTYLIHNGLVSQGTYSITADNHIVLTDTKQAKVDTLIIKYGDDAFLQLTNNTEPERISVYYKSNYAFTEATTSE